ncbi:MAG: methyltransferase domain-containing protein [Pseudonocardiaceae bacterium]
MMETHGGKPISEQVSGVVKIPYLVLRSAATDLLFDRRYGVRTSGQIEPGDLGLNGHGCHGYRPAGWMTLRRILPPRDVTNHDVFVDLGSGMGRVVLQAASYPFRKVIGVEISETLHDIARDNLDRNRRRLRCPDIELVHADVLDYELPDDVTVAFLYNPFQGEIFATVLERLLQSVERNPRPLRIIYVNPVEERLLVGAGRIRHVRTVGGWRPNQEWSRSNSIRMYETVYRPTR